MFDFEEREPLSSILIARSCDQAWQSSRRPRSPSSNHNVKERYFGVNFNHARKTTPPARSSPTGGVGAVYRRAIYPCQIRNCLNFRFFVSGFGIGRRLRFLQVRMLFAAAFRRAKVKTCAHR
jgi:hypothetical protein